ncbi:MAG: hypothetical protein KAJ18_01525 [Candidatus Omnitrophica bacterium]|nr:hypothetical protein [Candidatus Omnitrophota bacterium]
MSVDGETTGQKTHKEVEWLAKDFYEEGLVLFREKKYNRALTKFKLAAKLIPDYENVKYYIKKLPDIAKERKRRRAEQLD